MSEIDLQDRCVLEVGAGDIRHLCHCKGFPSEYILADIAPDMMKLADVSCEEIYEKVSDSWVSHMSVPNGFDKDDDEGDDLCWCKFYESCPSCYGKK